MARFWLPVFAVCAALVGTIASSEAASLKDVAGTWSFVSNTAEHAGQTIELFGPGGKGRMVLGADGRYMIVIVRADVPKFASGNRLAGTPEENKAAVQGSNAHFGTFMVDDAGRVLTFRIEGASFPNWDKAEQKRQFTLVGTELKYTIPTSTTGSGPGIVVWKRLD